MAAENFGFFRLECLVWPISTTTKKKQTCAQMCNWLAYFQGLAATLYVLFIIQISLILQVLVQYRYDWPQRAFPYECTSQYCHRWIPLTKASDSELWYYLRLNKWLSKQSIRRWFETPSCSLWWRHCNCNKIWLISLTLLIHKMCCAPNKAPNVSFFSLTVRD